MSPDPAEVIIRQGREHEMETVVALMRRVMVEVYASRYPKLKTDYEATGGAYLKYPALCRRFILAEVEGRIVGVVWTFEDKVMELFIDAAMRSRGIGAALLSAAEEKLRRAGVMSARLDAAEEFPEVIGFYEQCGWRTVRQHSDESGTIPLLEMSKQLQPRWSALGWALIRQSPRAWLAGCILAATYMLADGSGGGLPQVRVLAYMAWLFMVYYAVWNALLVPVDELTSWKTHALVMGALVVDISAMNVAAELALLPLSLSASKGASGWAYIIVGTAIVFAAVTLADQIARGLATWAWQRCGFNLNTWFYRPPKLAPKPDLA